MFWKIFYEGLCRLFLTKRQLSSFKEVLVNIDGLVDFRMAVNSCSLTKFMCNEIQ